MTTLKVASYLLEIQNEFDPWIGFDLDGTLAYYESGYCEKGIVGDPIPSMITVLRSWLEKGATVKIFTARANSPEHVQLIRAWLKKQGLPDLEITDTKGPGMVLGYDDRIIQVRKNTGEILGNPDEIELRH